MVEPGFEPRNTGSGAPIHNHYAMPSLFQHVVQTHGRDPHSPVLDTLLFIPFQTLHFQRSTLNVNLYQFLQWLSCFQKPTFHSLWAQMCYFLGQMPNGPAQHETLQGERPCLLCKPSHQEKPACYSQPRPQKLLLQRVKGRDVGHSQLAW